MNTMLRKTISASAISGAMLLSTIAPAFAATDITIKDNGADSKNKVVIEKTSRNEISQSNNTRINVDLDVKGHTGKNKASGNTGGDTSIKTGDVTTNLKVTASGSKNTLTDNDDCDCDGELKVTIKDNGKKSKNTAKLIARKTKIREQRNRHRANIDAKVRERTGKNKAKNNTKGDTKVTTGKVETTVTVSATGPSNDLE